MEIFRNPYLMRRKIIKVLNLLLLAPFFKKYGKGTRIENAYYLTPQHIELGRNVLICKNARIEGVSQYEGLKFRPKIVIEDNVSIVGQQIRNENGLDNAITEIEKYFNDTKKYGT